MDASVPDRGKKTPKWKQTFRPGRLYSKLEDGRIQCKLSPRGCKMKEGQIGFCGVRLNKDGVLHTLNYGKSVNLTEEYIETEGVFHYMPGARILSLGNIGCNLDCDFCQNWKTSQARLVEDHDVHEYTPKEIVTRAEQRGIPVLSWTYNDPVVWHEFVMDTGGLAHQHGLKNLFKSAFFISLEGAAELCDVIDIFSISIKTVDEKLYKKMTKGALPPVLEATKYVFSQGKHVEVSNLMVTDVNDSENHAVAVADWVLKNLSDEVPLHFVRFHPDYKYTRVGRTPVERVAHAREIAMKMGIKYCYLGNVYGNDGTNTYCTKCGSLLISRYGLNTVVYGLGDDRRCVKCQTPLNVTMMQGPLSNGTLKLQELPSDLGHELCHEWEGELNACHVEVKNNGEETIWVYYWRKHKDGSKSGPFGTHIQGHDNLRFVISKASPDETGVIIQHPDNVLIKIYRLFDRAHYPTEDIFS